MLDLNPFHSQACCDYLRVALTKKVVHCREGVFMRQCCEQLKEVEESLMEFRPGLKALAAQGKKKNKDKDKDKDINDAC